MYKSIYNKRGIEPKNIESKFEIDELFFSTTDLKGIIESGNEVFIRVSKFKKDELIGKPHNTIRHPDMPRAIFRLLWNSIKSKKPFVGYVKNMAKDGSYYWVLAAVYPIFDEKGNVIKYLSIRIKPVSKMFEIIPKFYNEILEYEKREGVEKALDFMKKRVTELGFKDYEDFSKKAFLEEVKAREIAIDKDSVTCAMGVNISNNEKLADELCSLQTNFLRLSRYFNEIYSKINTFLDMNESLTEKSNFIFKLAEEIRLLSLNASIESYKIKKEGVSFSTLSQEMRKNAEFSEKEIERLSKLILETNEDIEDTSFNILSSKLQIDMIVYFLKEILDRLTKGNLTKDEEIESVSNIKNLYHLLKYYSIKLSDNVYNSKRKLRNIYYNIKNLNNLISRLDFIHINGLIESAHSGSDGGSFTIIFSQMLKFVEAAKEQIIDLETNISIANEENLTIDILNNFIEERIYKLEKRYQHFFELKNL